MSKSFVTLLCNLIEAFPTWRRQAKCDHKKHSYRETMACDAICRGCGANLGFIGTVREQRTKEDGQEVL